MKNKEAIELCLQENELVCPEVLDLFSILNKIAKSYLNATVHFFEDEKEIHYPHMDIKESINLVREFLGSIDQKYLVIFNKSLNDGTFELFLPEDDLVERPEYPVTFPKPDVSINIPVQYNYDDGVSLVHEFFHFINDTEDLIGVRDIFTEMISIYYEIRYCQFLNKKGYNSLYLYNEIYDRIDNSLNSAYSVCYTSSVFDIYHNTGDITKENINFIDDYRNLYNNNIDNIINFYNSDEFNKDIDSFREAISYTVGTLLTFFALKNTKIYDVKIKYLNNNINNLSIDDILTVLDTKFEEHPIWIEECVKNLKKALGEINEQNYSNSGTHRSR